MNAFDPMYVKTYMPEMMQSIRKEEKQRLNGIEIGQRGRKTRESVMGIGACNIAAFPKTKESKQ
jgi:hypothetical protein